MTRSCTIALAPSGACWPTAFEVKEAAPRAFPLLAGNTICRLKGSDPYTYLVDVLLRISVHPASQVLDLTPRRWKEKFAHRPMQSDLALADQ